MNREQALSPAVLPARIEPEFVPRIWGRSDLSPLFPSQTQRIGEVWFSLGNDFPLLVKFIFTSERLSVQVHPDDEYAGTHEKSRGKTEMWHILNADPGATLALGLKQPVTKDELRRAIEDTSVENLLDWIPVSPGQTFFAEAGTIHAIGAGVALCEIQQNSDVTYRLYDYGRPRELHIEKGLSVANTGVVEGRRELPVECEHFVTDAIDADAPAESNPGCEHLLIPVAGRGWFGDQPFEAGQVWHVPATSGAVPIRPAGAVRVLRTHPRVK